MSKQVLALGIVLSLGVAGCAGVGVQQGSSVTAQARQQQGLDNLWSPTEQVPTQSFETPRYADQRLGGLWSTRVEEPAGVHENGSYEERTRGDLWNSARVTHGWDGNTRERQNGPSMGLSFRDSPRQRQAGRRVSAQ